MCQKKLCNNSLRLGLGQVQAQQAYVSPLAVRPFCSVAGHGGLVEVHVGEEVDDCLVGFGKFLMAVRAGARIGLERPGPRSSYHAVGKITHKAPLPCFCRSIFAARQAMQRRLHRKCKPSNVDLLFSCRGMCRQTRSNAQRVSQFEEPKLTCS